MKAEPMEHKEPVDRKALYCRYTGRRLAPEEGLEPANGSPVAVIVLDDGQSIPLFGDAVLGRTPELDRRVTSGEAQPIVVADPTNRISRCHVLLRIRRFDVEVIDLGSRNGTSVSSGDGEWTPVLPGLGNHVVEGQEIRMASRVLTIHHLRR